MLAEALLSLFRQVELFFPSPPSVYSSHWGPGLPEWKQMFQCRAAAVALRISAITACSLGAPQLRPEARAAEASSLVVGRGMAQWEH